MNKGKNSKQDSILEKHVNIWSIVKVISMSSPLLDIISIVVFMERYHMNEINQMKDLMEQKMKDLTWLQEDFWEWTMS